jgi:uncharacterized ion transporter superfamily protein YfcC
MRFASCVELFMLNQLSLVVLFTMSILAPLNDFVFVNRANEVDTFTCSVVSFSIEFGTIGTIMMMGMVWSSAMIVMCSVVRLRH